MFLRKAVFNCLQTAALDISPARSSGFSPEALTDRCLPVAVGALGLFTPDGCSVRRVLFGCEDVPDWAHEAVLSGTESRAPPLDGGKMFPRAEPDPSTLSGALHIAHAGGGVWGAVACFLCFLIHVCTWVQGLLALKKRPPP